MSIMAMPYQLERIESQGIIYMLVNWLCEWAKIKHEYWTRLGIMDGSAQGP